METNENSNGAETSIPPAPAKEYLDKEDLVAAAETAEKPAKAKPWIEAGFKSRAEWRASKRPASAEPVKETAAVEKKPAKKAKQKETKKMSAKTQKKPAKKPPATKRPKAKVEAKGRKTKAERKLRKGDRKYKPLRTEPSEMQKKLLSAFGGVGKVGELKAMGEKAYKTAPAEKRFSWARNNIRWLFANKFVSHVAPGQYKRLK